MQVSVRFGTVWPGRTTVGRPLKTGLTSAPAAALPSTDPEELKTWFTANGTQWIVAPHHPYWPSQLADLTIHTDWAAPLCLWGKGDPQALVSCSEPVGVVGSRGVSEYGRQSAHELAKQAARAGHLIVSGGALGTDAAAHWGAIQAMDEIGTPHAGRTGQRQTQLALTTSATS